VRPHSDSRPVRTRVGSGFWRVVGAADAIEEKAVAMPQQFLRAIGFARALAIG
jgi:hypothetical protein